jgi:hypothetical protein
MARNSEDPAAESTAATGVGGRLDALLGRRIWPALSLLSASVLVTVADQLYAADQGRVFTLGPLRAVWLSGLLMMAGLLALVYRFFPRAR